MEVALITLFFLLGSAVGSFLNVCMDRLPADRSLLRPASHCDSCQHPLSVSDLVPIFSYLWLRRRCRYCQAALPRRPFWVELGSAGLFAFGYWYYGLSLDLAVIIFYCCLFIVLAVIDLEHGLILNKIVYPAAVVALVISAFYPPSGIIDLALGWPWFGLVNSVTGGAIGLIFFLLPALIYPEGMGWGDIKMAGLIGLVTGSGLVLFALLIGIILGGLVAGILLLLKVRGWREAIPFGPFLSVGTIAILLWGSDIINWYLGLFF